MSIEAGNLLREAREQKGISIKEASDALHIRIPYLQALENGRAEIIPSAVQARGFLRIYSEFLSLSTNDMLQEWDHPGTTPLTLGNKEEPKPSETETPQVSYTPPVTPSFLPRDTFITPVIPPTNIPGYDQNIAGKEVPIPSSLATEQKNEIADEPVKEKKKRSPLFKKAPKEKPPEEDPEKTAKDLFKEIGDQLAYRRKFLSLSLEDCESQTLIRSIYIQSMEDGNFEQLPSFIQARGMLSNYASFLDLDVDDLLLKLATAIQLLSQKKNNRGNNSKKRKPTKTAGKVRKFFTPDLFVGIFVIVGIAGIIIYSAITIAAYRRNISSEPTADLGISLIEQYLDTTRTPEFLPTTSPVPADFTSQDISSQIIDDEPETETEEPEVVIQSNRPVQLFVTANQRTFMRVVSDGREVFSGRTIPNNTYPFDAENLIELTTGNADALSVVYNQQNLGKLGRLGETITVDFTPYLAATPTPQFSPTPTNTYEPTYTPMPETPLPTNTPTPYIP